MSFFEFPHTRTYDSDLGWLIEHINSYDETIAALNAWIEENEPRIEEIEALFDLLMSGDLPPGIQEGINNWMQSHAIDLVGQLVKTVFFGLTNDGYFVAYIPDSWDDITFNTTEWDIFIATMPDYGHLVLSY